MSTFKIQEETSWIDLHNRIFHFIMINSDVFTHVDFWHGKHIMKYENYDEWILNVSQKLDRQYLIDIYPRYYQLLSAEEISDEDEEEMYELKHSIYKYLGVLYPSLICIPSGSFVDYESMFIDQIIDPYLLKSPFPKLNISGY